MVPDLRCYRLRHQRWPIQRYAQGWQCDNLGCTPNNLERRLGEHSEGLGEARKFTGRYQCNLLVYFEIIPDAKQAIAREKQVKNWTRAKKEFLINTFNTNWEPIDLQTWSR